MHIRIFAIIAVLFHVSFVAEAGDPFTVAGVHVEATAENALEARTQALSLGQIKAANILIRRMSLAADRAKQGFEGVSMSDGQRMIRALEIANEKRSATRYLGDITVAFNKDAVAQYMQINGLRLISTQARKRLVIPLLEDGTNRADNEWTRAWEKRGFEHLLTPLVVMNRPFLERVLAGSISDASLRSAAQTFGVEQVLIVRATSRGSAGYHVSITDISLDGEVQTRKLANVSGLTAMDAVDAVSAAMEADWKDSVVSVSNTENVELVVSVLYRSHPEWQGLQDVINNSQQIRTAQLVALSNKGALMSLGYGGDFKRLQGELAFKGVSIRRDDELGVVLFKTTGF